MPWAFWRSSFFWLDNEQDEPRIHGVWCAVRNSSLCSVEPPSKGSAPPPLSFLSSESTIGIYAPTLITSAADPTFFLTMSVIWNSRLLSEESQLRNNYTTELHAADSESWPRSIYHIVLCSMHKLTNTFFATKLQNKTILAPSKIASVAPAGSSYFQKILAKLLSHHPQFPQCWLRHRPLAGWHQGAFST